MFKGRKSYVAFLKAWLDNKAFKFYYMLIIKLNLLLLNNTYLFFCFDSKLR
jgi:hypothetical protein